MEIIPSRSIALSSVVNNYSIWIDGAAIHDYYYRLRSRLFGVVCNKLFRRVDAFELFQTLLDVGR